MRESERFHASRIVSALVFSFFAYRIEAIDRERSSKQTTPMLFEAESRLTQDKCCIKTRVLDNNSQMGYRLENPREKAGDRFQDFAQKHRNLRPWDGYGLRRDRVDVDSQFKNHQIWTNDPSKQQLKTRTFTAVPNLRRGRAMPDRESVLINGQDTSSDRMCNPLTERQFDVFHPTVTQVSSRNIIQPWTRGGASSREIARSPEFLESLGYTHDGRAWVHEDE